MLLLLSSTLVMYGRLLRNIWGTLVHYNWLALHPDSVIAPINALSD